MLFFRLFESFECYTEFFLLLNDLVDQQGNIRFYLPFDDFQSPPEFRDVEDYFTYRDQVVGFINARNIRIEEYARYLKRQTE